MDVSFIRIYPIGEWMIFVVRPHFFEEMIWSRFLSLIAEVAAPLAEQAQNQAIIA